MAKTRTASPEARNVTANWINFLVSAVAGLIVNPLLLNGLGAQWLGVWKGTQRVLDLTQLLSGRSAQALKWVVSHRSGTTDDDEKRRDVGASIIFSLFLMPVMAIAAVFLVAALPTLIEGIGDLPLTPIYVAGSLLAANLVLSGLLMVPDAVLIGTNQGFRSTHITTLFLVASNVAMLAVALLGWGIPALGAIVLVAAVGNAIVTWLIARRHVAWWGIARPTRADLRRVGGFSGWSMGWRFVNQMLATVDGILIGALIGAVAIAQFTFSSYVVTLAIAICGTTTSAFMPALGRAIGAGDQAAARRRIGTVKNLNLFLVTITGSGILALNEGFVTLWAGSDMYLGAVFNVFLVVEFIQLALIRNDSQIQDAALNIRPRVLIGVAATLMSVGLAITAYQILETPWAILGGIIIGRLPMTIFYLAAVRRIANASKFRVRPVLVAATVILGSAIVGTVIPTLSLIGWLMYAVVVGVIVALASWFGVASPEMRRQLTNMLRARGARG